MVACVVCGRDTRPRRWARVPNRCLTCSLAASVRQQTQLASRQGPEYEAAVRNGHLGGRPRKLRDSPDQLALPLD